MWESNNLDNPAGEEPGGPEPDRALAGPPREVPATPHVEIVGEPQAAAHWSGPVLHGMSTPRVFSALASAAGTPSPAGGNGSKTVVHVEQVVDYEEEDENEADAARRRAQQRWRELNPGPVLPSLSLTEEEAAALLPPVERPVESASPVPAAVAPSTRVAPWLPAP